MDKIKWEPVLVEKGWMEPNREDDWSWEDPIINLEDIEDLIIDPKINFNCVKNHPWSSKSSHQFFYHHSL